MVWYHLMTGVLVRSLTGAESRNAILATTLVTHRRNTTRHICTLRQTSVSSAQGDRCNATKALLSGPVTLIQCINSTVRSLCRVIFGKVVNPFLGSL